MHQMLALDFFHIVQRPVANEDICSLGHVETPNVWLEVTENADQNHFKILI